MLLIVPVVIATLAALLRGGSLRHLATLPVRGSGFIFASLAIQVLLYMPPFHGSAVIVRWGGAIYIGALALALIGALRNWHLGVAARIALLGLALNAIVIVFNGGHMPVNAVAMRRVLGDVEVRQIADQRLYSNTLLAGPSSRLVVLSDVIPVSLPGNHGNVYSIGDVLLTIGVAALAYRATRGRGRHIEACSSSHSW
jgi:Family of unknown function (DUF5317)